MLYSNSLDSHSVVDRFKDADRIIDHLGSLWKIGDVAIKFGVVGELEEEHINGEIFRLLGSNVIDNHLVKFSETEMLEIEKSHDGIKYASSLYNAALFMPYITGGTYEERFGCACSLERDIMQDSLETLSVPYAIANISDRHTANIMASENSSNLITIDTRHGLFNSSFKHPYRGQEDDVIATYKENNYRMGIREPDKAEPLKNSLEQCEKQIKTIARQKESLNKFRHGMAEDLINRATTLKNYFYSSLNSK